MTKIYNCVGMTSVSIPDSVTSIGWYAFSGCGKLSTVFYAGTREQFNAVDIGSGNDDLLNAAIYTSDSPLYGDVNGDGDIDTRDLTVLRQYLSYPVGMTLAEGANVDGNGTIDTMDLTYLRFYLADPSTVLGPTE